ncbi:MAG: hypothetical protein EON85_09565 [Brevundimonas sp.]|nr:MAG: hypothetical protein EON85_09565 [Brevundimonas sp.]
MRRNLYPEQHILHLDLNGVTAENALASAIPMLQARPELWNWDWVIDTRIVPTDASVGQIARLAELFRKPERKAFTVFATDDRFLHLWARVMDFQFPGRQHLIVPTAVAGVRLIGKRRSAMKMNRI